MSAADNKALLERFYAAFAEKDHETMAACYAPDAHFEDPVFTLDGSDVGGMWRMLCIRGTDLELEYSGIEADDKGGKAHWEAWYTLSSTGRKVHNIIDGTFTFNDDGLIATHIDRFDFYRWSRQGIGFAGLLLGWTPLIRNKVRGMANKDLRKFLAKEAA